MDQTSDITLSAAYQAALTYEQFFVPGIFRHWTPLLLQRAAPERGERVLDVACGTGIVARSLVPLVGPEGRVTGLDINPAMLAVACRQHADHCDDIDWREGRAEELPFPDGEFDLVTCQQGLQFFEDKDRAAAEMRRVLRPDGRAVVAVWQSVDANPLFGAFFAAEAQFLNTTVDALATPFSFGDPLALERLFRKGGFGHVKVEPVEHQAHFEERERFIELSIKGAASVMPEFAEMGSEAIDQLRSYVSRRVEDLLNAHTSPRGIEFPLRGNFATARP
jgi:ubiquinone/menaquinone biosynthesis C-methylase UbiE